MAPQTAVGAVSINWGFLFVGVLKTKRPWLESTLGPLV